jgi:regulatory protein
MGEEEREIHQAEKLYEKTMQRALRLLSYRARTVAEMRQRLLDKSWAVPAIVEQVIVRLQELQYLNDETFAERFAASRLEGKPMGATRLRFDLQRKRLSAGIVDQALREAYAAQPEESLLEKVIEQWMRRKGSPTTPEARRRLLGFLMRRGFSMALSLRMLEQIPLSTVTVRLSDSTGEVDEEPIPLVEETHIELVQEEAAPPVRNWPRRSLLRRRPLR